VSRPVPEAASLKLPCELKPEARMTHYGYQMPPSMPERSITEE
jgi:hypothetical protein